MGEGGRQFANPLEGLAVGDPFVLRHRGRFYLYGTNDGPALADGRVVPVFRSDDLLRWEPLGGALVPSRPGADHWAPEVLTWNGRFYMVVSFGDVERTGHELWVAVADRPEGPFELARRVSTPDERFSIDGAWLLDDDGRLYLYRCLDFVAEDDPPHGTGIVVQPMRDPLTPAGPAATVLRAHADWHLFEADRLMPLYEGRRFGRWTTIEGPAPVRRAGRYFCGYSGGNYTGAYGTGEAVADAPLGPYRDLRGREGPLFGTQPGLVEGPGHFSVVRPDLVHDWIVLHGRRPGEPFRRVWLCPARWWAEGVMIGPLDLATRPAPPLPDERSRFSGMETGVLSGGWSCDGGTWTVVEADGLRHEGVPGRAWRAGPPLAGDWVAEAWVRLVGPGSRRAGLVVRAGGVETALVIGDERFEVVVHGQVTATAPLPTLGDERFRPEVFHALELRCGGGRWTVRVDGVVVDDAPAGTGGDLELGLAAEGAAVFDAVALTRIG